MKLSLKLQKPCTTLADSLLWVETTAELLDDLTTRSVLDNLVYQ